jgi:hypothetical protein
MSEWHTGKDKAREMFGQDAGRMELLSHLMIRAHALHDSPFRAGFVTCIEEIAAVTDTDAGDGRSTVQTLIEQMIGLLDGRYALVEVTTEDRAKVFRLISEQGGSA